MISSEEANEVMSWFSDSKTVEKLSPEEFGTYVGAALKFAETLKPIYDAHHTQTYELLLKNLLR